MNSNFKWLVRFDNDSADESQLKMEILRSERLREFVLGGVILLLASGLFLNILFLSSDVKNTMPDLVTAFEWIIILFLFLAARSFIVRAIINKRMKTEKGLPGLLRYTNAFLETSIPTLGLMILALHIEPVAALLSPMLLLYFFIIIISSLELDPKLSFFTGFIAALEYLFLAMYYLNQTEERLSIPVFDLPAAFIVRSIILFLSGILAGIVSMKVRKNITNTIRTIQERNDIQKTFGQQVSKEIADELIKNKYFIKSRSRYVAIMFLDIKDFSAYAEYKSPEEIIRYQNQVFSFMIEIVNRHHGIINQILGDGFMAVFGAPIQRGNDCQLALDAAIEISEALKTKNNSGEIPLTSIRIGINAGLVVTGNVGTDERKQYSITGKPVIIAARLEQLNKELGSTILISEEVYKNVEHDTSFISKHNVIVKGHSTPIQVYQIL